MNAEIRQGMIAMLGDDPALLDEIYGDFVAEVHKALDASAIGLGKGDFASLRTVAHTLKGCAANIGAEQIRQLAFDWQRAAEAQDAAACRASRAALAAILPLL